MSRMDPEKLLQELANVEEERADPQSDELLRAFRAGELGEEETLGVIRALAGNPAARERLAELTGVALPRPRGSARRALLDRLAGSASGPRRRTAARWGWGLAAAAALSVVLAWPLWRPSAGPLPPVAVGLGGGPMAKRALEPVSSLKTRVDAQRDNRVYPELQLEAGAAPAALRVGLYLDEDGTLVKVLEEDHLPTVEGKVAGRGAKAAELARVGLGGEHVLFAVVTWADDKEDFPSTVSPHWWQSKERALSAGHRWRVTRLTLNLLP